jgi:predicted nuclease with TOPRIM domain
VTAIPGDTRAALGADLSRIAAEYKRVWRRRNREGGLRDSVGRLERLLRIYSE